MFRSFSGFQFMRPPCRADSPSLKSDLLAKRQADHHGYRHWGCSIGNSYPQASARVMSNLVVFRSINRIRGGTAYPYQTRVWQLQKPRPPNGPVKSLDPYPNVRFANGKTP